MQCNALFVREADSFSQTRSVLLKFFANAKSMYINLCEEINVLSPVGKGRSKTNVPLKLSGTSKLETPFLLSQVSHRLRPASPTQDSHHSFRCKNLFPRLFLLKVARPGFSLTIPTLFEHEIQRCLKRNRKWSYTYFSGIA